MTIRFTCECGKVLKASDENAGKRAKCPACGNTIQIPSKKTFDTLTQAESKNVVLDQCANCGGKFLRQEMIENNDSIICKQCFEESLEHSAKVKKTVLFTSLTVILTAFVCITFVFLFFDFEKAHVNIAEKTEVNEWPFVTKIPADFKFERIMIWEGRIFWILKGSQFGQAHKTIIVFRSNPQTLVNDIIRAPYWAAELSVGLSIGETQRGQKGMSEDETMKPTFVASESGDFNQAVILLTPSGKKLKKKEMETQVTKMYGVDIMVPSIPEISDFYPPKISLEELGKPEDFVPDGLSAKVGWSRGPLWLVACASEPEDFRFKYDSMLADLYRNLCRELGETYQLSPDTNKGILQDEMIVNLKSVIPLDYKFIKRQMQDSMILWVFKGKQLPGVQETLLVIRWENSVSFRVAGEPFTALTNCARWAGECSINNKLSSLGRTLPLKEMGLVVKGKNGQYKLLDHFIDSSVSKIEDGNVTERSFSFSLNDLMTIGEQIEDIRCISFDDNNDTNNNSIRVSVISRAVSLGLENEGFIVFAGATEGKPDKFWRMVQTVDEFADNCIRHNYKDNLLISPP